METQLFTRCTCTSVAERGWREASSHANQKFKITNLPWSFHSAPKSCCMFLACLLFHPPRLFHPFFPSLKPLIPPPWSSFSTNDPVSYFSEKREVIRRAHPLATTASTHGFPSSLLLTNPLSYSRTLVLSSPILACTVSFPLSTVSCSSECNVPLLLSSYENIALTPHPPRNTVHL